MTYEEVLVGLDPFDTNYAWRRLQWLDLDADELTLLLVDPGRDLATVLTVFRDSYKDQLQRLLKADSLGWADATSLLSVEDLDSNGWFNGTVEDMIQWTRGLWDDV